MLRHLRAKPVAALVASVICWSTVPVFIRFLSANLGAGIVGNFTQNLYRYVPACALLWILTLVFFRRFVRMKPMQLLGLLAPTVIIFCHQIAWVAGITFTTPTTAALLTQVQAVGVSALVFIFFREERATVRGIRFLAGSSLALVGVVGFIWFGGGKLSGSALGYAIVLGAAVIWAVYIVVAKAVTRGLHPVVSFTYVSTGTLMLFIFTTPSLGEPAKILHVSGWVVAVLVVSGVIGISLAHIFFYRALADLDAAVCGTAILASPVFTGIWSFIFYGEILRPIQFLFAALLLAGAGLAMRRTPPPEPID